MVVAAVVRAAVVGTAEEGVWEAAAVDWAVGGKPACGWPRDGKGWRMTGRHHTPC